MKRAYLWLAVPAAVVLSGCPEGDPSELSWTVRFADDADKSRSAFVDTWVTEGGCDGSGDEVYRATISLPGGGVSGPDQATLGSGAHAFHAQAVASDCTNVGTVCVQVDLPSDGPVVLEIPTGMGGDSLCGATEICLGNGRCMREMIPDGSVACEGEGMPCEDGSGTCHGGECCFGCWDEGASVCQSGAAASACGSGGGACVDCGAGNVCRAASCEATSSEPQFALTPIAVIYRDADGLYYAGGDNRFDQLGPVTDTGGAVALAGYTGALRFVDIGGTQFTSCGITAAGALHCWGRNANGLLGIGNTDPMVTETEPVPVDALNSYGQVDGGDTHMCAITSAGRLFCWGDNTLGQLGTGSAGGSRSTPAEVTGGGTWQQVSLLGSHTCAIRGDGALFCWGDNATGQLGTGDMMSSAEPRRVGSETDWRWVSAGTAHTCGIRGRGTDGRLFCWGRGEFGELGTGETGMTANRSAPTAVAEAQTTWRQVAAGQFHTCALLEMGGENRAFCWGVGFRGALGREGNLSDSPTPAPVSGSGSWSAIYTSWEFSCGIRGGTPVCWGDGRDGKLGTGVADITDAPTETMLVAP